MQARPDREPTGVKARWVETTGSVLSSRQQIGSQPGCGFSSCALMAQSAISSLWPRYLT